jgi:hypothetical protein
MSSSITYVVFSCLDSNLSSELSRKPKKRADWVRHVLRGNFMRLARREAARS